MIAKAFSVAGLMAVSACAQQEPISVTVRADRPGHAVPKTLYGIFFEDINYAADGGIYPELIANRGFDWRAREPEGWTREWRGEAMGRVSLQGGWPVHPNTFQYLRVECYAPGEGAGVANAGFGGIAVKRGGKYDLSFYARPHAGYEGGLTVRLEDADKKALAAYRIGKGAWRNTVSAGTGAATLDAPPPPDWGRYEAVFTPSESVTNARLVILLDARGTVDLELVSLFPQDTFKGRKNGMRKDLMEWLAEMKPATLRFPGGCVVEGYDFETLYHWKRTVGPLERRAVNHNRWGYWQTHGLGYFEYFQMAEDLGAEPLPILAAGMTCQFRKPLECLPLDSLDGVVQDAVDLIEFANGAPDTPWGRVRAEMGHPASFNLKYLGIGNENWDNLFLDRYEIIAKAVKAKHPGITIISSAGAAPDGPMFDLAWKRLPGMQAELVDEHYYKPPEWFLAQANRYDNYDRNGPKVYVGEYACHTRDRKNNLLAALCEAAAMTGFERNSDVVRMAAYAPLFNKIGSTQWNVDLIWFDNVKAFGTPSFYVQKLFMNHLPDVLLPVEASANAAPLPPAGTIGLHTWETAAEFKDIRVTRGGETLYAFDPQAGTKGWSKPKEGAWSVKDGALRQADAGVHDTATSFIAGAPWENYTLELSARKLSGKEGFIIRVRDQRDNAVHLNLGGWGNKDHGIERNGQNPVVRKPGSIETGRWYAIKIQLDGDRVRAWLDGQSLFDLALPNGPAARAYLVAGLDQAAGEIVVKGVNPRAEPVALALSLAGAKVAAQKARRITLAGGPDDVNTMEAPLRIAPQEDTLDLPGAVSQVTLPAHSFTIIRVKVE
jgi:alpha-L-arabinofuranosidase